MAAVPGAMAPAAPTWDTGPGVPMAAGAVAVGSEQHINDGGARALAAAPPTQREPQDGREGDFRKGPRHVLIGHKN